MAMGPKDWTEGSILVPSSVKLLEGWVGERVLMRRPNWPPHEDPLADPAFQELYARWYEYGAFCPIFRTHGHRPQNEMWSFDKVEPILLTYDKLRYRLMTYIYSLA